MNQALKNCIDKLLSSGDIEVLYLYGSYVNGYYEKDSDIDLVALSEEKALDKPVNYRPNISVHYITSSTMNFFETGRAYAHLRMVPIHNSKKCKDISSSIKSELVRRELIRFKRKGVPSFEANDLINNFLLGYALERPWRIKPIKRILASEEAQKILREEYEEVFPYLEERGMIIRQEEKYKINDKFLFDEGLGPAKVDEGFRFKFKHSYCGWHYLTNLPTIINFAKKRI